MLDRKGIDMPEYVRSKPHVVILAPHNSQVAHDISKTLRSHSISAFLAPEDIKPGEAWMTRILDEINNAKIAVTLSGISSQTDWAQLEMQLLLQRILSDPSFVVIPVINYPDDLS